MGHRLHILPAAGGWNVVDSCREGRKGNRKTDPSVLFSPSRPKTGARREREGEGGFVRTSRCHQRLLNGGGGGHRHGRLLLFEMPVDWVSD